VRHLGELRLLRRCLRLHMPRAIGVRLQLDVAAGFRDSATGSREPLPRGSGCCRRLRVFCILAALPARAAATESSPLPMRMSSSARARLKPTVSLTYVSQATSAGLRSLSSISNLPAATWRSTIADSCDAMASRWPVGLRLAVSTIYSPLAIRSLSRAILPLDAAPGPVRSCREVRFRGLDLPNEDSTRDRG
jgi:hypothetical protein